MLRHVPHIIAGIAALAALASLINDCRKLPGIIARLYGKD